MCDTSLLQQGSLGFNDSLHMIGNNMAAIASRDDGCTRQCVRMKKDAMLARLS